jgi:hypothetical protein
MAKILGNPAEMSWRVGKFVYFKYSVMEEEVNAIKYDYNKKNYRDCGKKMAVFLENLFFGKYFKQYTEDDVTSVF